MASAELLVISASAFLAVFIVLIILALMMRTIVFIFAPAGGDNRAAEVAALASVLHVRFPGTRITKIEELK